MRTAGLAFVVVALFSALLYWAYQEDIESTVDPSFPVVAKQQIEEPTPRPEVTMAPKKPPIPTIEPKALIPDQEIEVIEIHPRAIEMSEELLGMDIPMAMKIVMEHFTSGGTDPAADISATDQEREGIFKIFNRLMDNEINIDQRNEELSKLLGEDRAAAYLSSLAAFGEEISQKFVTN